METPIFNFINEYRNSGALRFHMPGHKGVSKLGFEDLDITEIPGADSLYEANGIIEKSEQNASEIFGANTFYSTEGSSLCIRAMLYLISLYAKEQGISPVVAAGRNAHKTFVNSAALLDIDVQWLYGESNMSYLSCKVTPEEIENMFITTETKFVAVYLTSPDYLGNITDIKAISEICHKYGVLLMVDNAHGAYLKFIENSIHPIDSGADICCDSAHKTLPVLTGGAYLHISSSAPEILKNNAKCALSIFGSTSPSYIILQSLDVSNHYLHEEFRDRLTGLTKKIWLLKNNLINSGYILHGDEPLKLTIETKSYGYTGFDFSDILKQKNIICEFFDPDFVVLMLSPENSYEDIDLLENTLISIPSKNALTKMSFEIQKAERVISFRKAMFSQKEELPVNECYGRIMAAVNVGCPPAVPIVVYGEKIDETAIKCMKYYGIKKCLVVKN